MKIRPTVTMLMFLFAAASGRADAQSRPAPDLHLRGDRFTPLTYDRMTPEQKTLTDHVLAGERGCAATSRPPPLHYGQTPAVVAPRGLLSRVSMNGPFNVLLRSPEMGDLAQKFGAYVRFHSSLPNKLNEFAILMTARFWNSQFEWHAHHRYALQAGLNAAVIEAVASGKRPASMQPDEEAVYNFCNELLNSREVTDATFRAAAAKLGERGVVDLVGVVGYYHMVSMLLNIDRYPLPEGVKPELKPLPKAGGQ